MKLARAWITLVGLSFRRLLWSVNSLMILFPLASCGAFVAYLRVENWNSPELAFEAYSGFLLSVFASFLAPVASLTFGSVGIGGDREDRTLLFLLLRPVPRPLVMLAKFVATIPLGLGVVMGTFYAYCIIMGPAGAMARDLYAPGICMMTLAYLALFHLFAVLFRHATIIGLIYALFFEVLIANMPGNIKQLAVNFYGRSMMYNAGLAEGIESPHLWNFAPLDTPTSIWTLLAITGLSLLAAMLVFQRREFRDLG